MSGKITAGIGLLIMIGFICLIAGRLGSIPLWIISVGTFALAGKAIYDEFFKTNNGAS